MNYFQEIIAALQKEAFFKEWRQKHPQAFISHFFNKVNASIVLTDVWQIGFYDPGKDKITTFLQEKEGFSQQGEEDVFKKETDLIEALELKKVDFSFEKARELWEKNFPALFGHEQSGEGFVILQTLEKTPLWNITSVSSTLKFLNMKINAQTGEIKSHQAVEVVQRDK